MGILANSEAGYKKKILEYTLNCNCMQVICCSYAVTFVAHTDTIILASILADFELSTFFYFLAYNAHSAVMVAVRHAEITDKSLTTVSVLLHVPAIQDSASC